MLLTESEVAERLRCSKEKVRRLRKSGKLTYIPGRPVLVDEADLNEYVEAAKCRRAHSTSRETKPTENGISTGPKDASESASALARQIWLKRRSSGLAM